MRTACPVCPVCPAYQQTGVRKEVVLEIQRRCGRTKPVVYHVTDKPPPIKSPVRASPVAGRFV